MSAGTVRGADGGDGCHGDDICGCDGDSDHDDGGCRGDDSCGCHGDGGMMVVAMEMVLMMVMATMVTLMTRE